MRITELLKQESIGLNVSVSTKEEAIDKLVDLMDAGGRLKDKAGYKEGILARRGSWKHRDRRRNRDSPCQGRGSKGAGSGGYGGAGRAWIMRLLTVLWQISCL